ncbi:hypothetical protein K402DRAFT_74144 [Aulographum hederae CBS 113979]|uniref:Uncharacterized protein n=1 Tax=Aulographum hederae CBS 113979 TaxID=1176131 RepID=A0A6G1HFC5_9PEZI|nr:hypothetical protein K402DRAFT_74144 [Aulographum hederae CBS 113979]
MSSHRHTTACTATRTHEFSPPHPEAPAACLKVRCQRNADSVRRESPPYHFKKLKHPAVFESPGSDSEARQLFTLQGTVNLPDHASFLSSLRLSLICSLQSPYDEETTSPCSVVCADHRSVTFAILRSAGKRSDDLRLTVSINLQLYHAERLSNDSRTHRTKDLAHLSFRSSSHLFYVSSTAFFSCVHGLQSDHTYLVG